MSLEFDPADPFPLLDLSTVPYGLQKEHALAVDAFLGFQIEIVEARMRRETERILHQAQWIGLDPNALQTPYTELRFMLSKLGLVPGDGVVDLGAAYGRMGLVMQAHHPECEFVGIEIAKPRVEEGARVLRKHNAKNAKLIYRDASDTEFILPDANAYFLYDLSDRATIKRVIDQLRERSRTTLVRVIGRGRATRDQIERNEPWLSEMVPAKHFGNFTIYSSRESK